MADDTQSDERRDFDQRFDPVFQRGFTGQAERSASSRFARPQEVAAPIPHYVAPVGLTPTPPALEVPTPSAPAGPGTVPAPEERVPSSSQDDVEPVRPRANPWNITLWVLMVVLAVGAALSFKVGLDFQLAGYFGGTDMSTFAYSTLLLGIAPFLVGGALAILILQLTRLALSWEKNQ